MNRIKIVQENGAYHLRTRDEEILLLKKTIAKDGYPIVVYSVSNFSVARKRNFSIITKNYLEMLLESKRPFPSINDHCVFLSALLIAMCHCGLYF